MRLFGWQNITNIGSKICIPLPVGYLPLTGGEEIGRSVELIEDCDPLLFREPPVQNKSILILAVAATSLISMSASAAVIASWSMPTAVPGSTAGTSYNYGAANAGELTSGTMLSSAHAAIATIYSSPAGNGSTYSFSSNSWAIGDYYQVSVSTIGYSGVSISWDQTRSSSGPTTFDAVMSIDGGANWTTILAGYSVISAGSAGTNTNSWNITTPQAAFTLTAAAGAAANGQANVLFRLRSTVTAAAAGGTNRIDNFIVSAVPAPGAIALLGLAGLIGRRRR